LGVTGLIVGGSGGQQRPGMAGVQPRRGVAGAALLTDFYDIQCPNIQQFGCIPELRTSPMENGILVALSSQTVLRRELETIANNLANMNTTGFKRERSLFRPYLAVEQGAADPRSDYPVLVQDVATVQDLTPGRLDATGNPLDLAIRGDGYFAVATPEGERYVRGGHFRLDEAGRIVTESGHAVMSDGGQPIQVNIDDTEITVAADGSVSTANGDLGRLRIVRFSRPLALEPTGGGLWMAREAPEDVASPHIEQGMLERANVEPILEIERMIRVQRAYESAKSLQDREDERIGKMMQTYVA
jgi:flagellar basal-body rod protein FlgF